MNLLIAIDDTDNEESIGTGRLAREMADHLAQQGLLRRHSVTRHQLLVHPDIPYTSHNSCACIAGENQNVVLEEVFHAAKGFLLQHFHKGANPGLCVAEPDAVPDLLSQFGCRAQREVLTLEEARTLADGLEVALWWQGETGQGCIGALAGVGLRRTGNDGRFIALPGIREIKGVVRAAEILGRTGIQRVAAVNGGTLDAEDLVDTEDWVRPSLSHGEAVLLVTKDGSHWRPAEKKQRQT